MSRMSWPSYFMQITRLVAQRSTCLRRKVGAIAVKDKRILATGYNGAPAKVTDCLVKGCLRQELGIPSGQRHEICSGLHAEQNTIIQAAIHGISLKGAEIYCTHQPCFICTKMIINCGIAAVHFAEPYPDPMGEAMLQEAGIPYGFIPFDDESPLPADVELP
ncbi:CMP/dCMP deaminase zinc-binding protein [uncultured delta proteobacterium]|uniref:CMP/dCMP deaminase zinc-binding protein n=1 Tax=uncultured delta proteobacterium TaxID=34034 RepID=A0A212JEN1_9DELT|nr:CMP/dCMP deaminase zinc-binding protein [uncultured delta proteobacterium]